MLIKKYSDMNESIKDDLTDQDLNGGISVEEYDTMLKKVQELRTKALDGTISTEEKVFSEVLYGMVTNDHGKLDFDMQYHRRLGFVNANKKKD